MAAPTPPKKKWFFRKTRELGEKEWAHGLRTNAFRRFFRTSKRIGVVQRINEGGNRARALRAELEGFAHHAQLSPRAVFDSRKNPNVTVVENMLDFIGSSATARFVHTKSDTLYHLRAGRESLELGTMNMTFHPTDRRLHVEVLLSTSGVMELSGEFPQPHWKRTLSKSTGMSVYTWDQVIPGPVINQTIHWRDARVMTRIEMEAYQKSYAKKPPAKKKMRSR